LPLACKGFQKELMFRGRTSGARKKLDYPRKREELGRGQSSPPARALNLEAQLPEKKRLYRRIRWSSREKAPQQGGKERQRRFLGTSNKGKNVTIDRGDFEEWKGRKGVIHRNYRENKGCNDKKHDGGSLKKGPTHPKKEPAEGRDISKLR